MTWQFLHRWYMPFAWITLSSLISVPLAIYLQGGLTMHPGSELGLAYGSHWVLRDDFLETIVPYVTSLGCAIWLFNGDGSTRWAAAWALAAGIFRLALPIALAGMADATLANGQHYIDWHTLRVVIWFADIQMFVIGIMLWVGFARFVGQSSSAPSRAEAYG
jgi:hypothetical protein